VGGGMTLCPDREGRDADRPADIPARGWMAVLKRTWKEAGDDNLNLVAAGVAFYFFLALVPLLASLVLTYGLVADPITVVKHLQGLTQVLPADAARLIGEQLISVTQAAQREKGFGLLLALLLALYGGMRGASSIITALNIAYEEKERRGFVRTSLLAFAMTLGIVLVGVIGIVAISAMSYVDELLRSAGPVAHWAVKLASWALAAALGSLAIAAIYRYGPDRDEPKWRWLTAGSLIATGLWLIATLGFGFYVSNFGSYNATYGSLGAVVALLMWLYLSAYVLLLGAELNAELEHQTARDTTKGPDRPMGKRGAAMADTVA
jgi:membrane protein